MLDLPQAKVDILHFPSRRDPELPEDCLDRRVRTLEHGTSLFPAPRCEALDHVSTFLRRELTAPHELVHDLLGAILRKSCRAQTHQQSPLDNITQACRLLRRRFGATNVILVSHEPSLV
jgi:hypothetical protein